MANTEATEAKRRDLLNAINEFLEPEPCVYGVAAVGSVATGLAGIASDIDAIVFMDPIDRFILPTESIWCPWDDTFYSIFVEDEKTQRDGIQLDLKFLDLAHWSRDQFEWPEYYRAGLAESWIAFDRDGSISRLIQARTEYDDDTRLSRLDEFVSMYDCELADECESNWQRHGPLICFGRLNAAYEGLVAGLFAYNRKWRFFRERETGFMLRLPWLPGNFEKRMLVAMNAPSLDFDGYVERFGMLRGIADDLIERLVAEGVYGDDPRSEAFIRTHDEPGRAWNMDEWNREHERRTRLLTKS